MKQTNLKLPSDFLLFMFHFVIQQQFKERMQLQRVRIDDKVREKQEWMKKGCEKESKINRKRYIYGNRVINIIYNQQIMSRQSWSSQEDQAITKLVKQYGIEDWTKIAFKLRDYLGMQKRTGKQCRERWYNHLSPSVSKKPWTQQEQQMLFTCHKNFGNRWKDISKLFIGRTDNDIKNHFYSTLRRSLRRLNKIVGEKNSTTQMRQIKPSVLSTIMSFIYEQEQHTSSQFVQSLKDLPLLIFQFAAFKPIKLNIKNANIQQIRQKTNQIFLLITRFNEQYQKNKALRRSIKSERLRKKSSFCSQSLEKHEVVVKIEDFSSYSKQESYPQQMQEQDQHKQRFIIKIQYQEQDFFDKNIDIKHLNATEFSQHHEDHQVFSHQEAIHVPNFHQFGSSPKQTKFNTHQAFSLQADDINDLHFHEPEEPSRLNIDDQDNIRFGNEIDIQKDGQRQAQLIDEVIQTHFVT